MKKLFTLLTLLVAMVTSAWADNIYECYHNGTSVVNTNNYFSSDNTLMGSPYNSNMTITFTNNNGDEITSSNFTKLTSGKGVNFTVSANNTASVFVVAVTKGDTSGNGIKLKKQNGESWEDVASYTDAPTTTYTRYEASFSNLAAGTYRMERNSKENAAVYVKVTEVSAAAKPVAPTFDPVAGTVEESSSVAITSTGATTILYQWGAAAIGSEGDWSGAQTYSPENKPVVPDYGSANNVLSVKASNTNGDTYGSATYTIKRTASLARTSAASVTLDPEQTSQITWSTSSTGDVTFESGDESVATVDESGLITAVAYGTAIITVRQAADAEYYAGSFTVSVSVNKVRKSTAVTGEFVLDTANGTQSSGSYTSTDGSVILEGSIDSGSNTYNDLKNSHFKHSSDITFTLPTNYPVSTVWFVGYGNGSNAPTITLKKVDGADVTSQSGSMSSSEQIPAADCVGFELENAATESMVINISKQSRGYFILNPAAKNITMTQVGTNYYASYYSAGEVTITGATAYTAELDAVNNKLTLTECVGGVVGGRTGVILIGNSASATATPSFTGASKNQGDLIGVAQKEVAMANYYAASTSAANKVFVLGAEGGTAGLYKYTGTNLGVNKAYLYNESLVSAPSLSFDFGNNTTAINGVNAEQVKSELKKFFENGRLVIENNGVRYNAAGQQLK